MIGHLFCYQMLNRGLYGNNILILEFVISTHILELAGELKQYDSVAFRCFQISMDGGEPRYTCKLQPGVSEERIGMYILNRERVVETILNAAEKRTENQSVCQVK